jgi:hypothetical protein
MTTERASALVVVSSARFRAVIALDVSAQASVFEKIFATGQIAASSIRATEAWIEGVA